MEMFLSCDWGTSAFRLRLIREADLRVLAEIKDDGGIAGTYQQWKQQQTVSREAFYTATLKSQIRILSQKTGLPLAGIPVMLSGMASSSIGMMELPYKKLPFNLDGSDLLVDVLNAGEDNPFIIISGARTAVDVMRGEETKVLGCASTLVADGNEHLLIFPGTHPKHVTVKGDQAVDLKTYMTGEFFDLLSTQSVLSASVEAGGDFGEPENQACFCEGVKASGTSSLLHAAFMVRTNQLVKNLPKHQNFYYLSGLVIGSELRNIPSRVPVYLIGGALHSTLYTTALQELEIPIEKTIDADLAFIRGQKLVFSTRYSS